MSKKCFLNFGYKSDGDCGYYTASVVKFDDDANSIRLLCPDVLVSAKSPLLFISDTKDLCKLFGIEVTDFFMTFEFANLLLNSYSFD